jgi:DNA-binding MarR family transcriptional regulator
MDSPASAFASDVRAALDAFRRIIQTLRASNRETERRVGLSAAQLFALQQLAVAPGASVNELAGRTPTHQSSVSVVIQRLVERKLVAKATAKHDRRRVQLALTDAGRAILRRSPEPVQERLIAGIAALSVSRRQTLVAALMEVVATLTTPNGPPPMFFGDRARRAARGAASRRGRRALFGRGPRA